MKRILKRISIGFCVFSLLFTPVWADINDFNTNTPEFANPNGGTVGTAVQIALQVMTTTITH